MSHSIGESITNLLRSETRITRIGCASHKRRILLRKCAHVVVVKYALRGVYLDMRKHVCECIPNTADADNKKKLENSQK